MTRHVQNHDEIEDTPSVEDKSPGPDTHIERKEFQGAVNLLAKELSVKQRKVFLLRDINGFTTEEVAKILRCSRITVRVHLAKARHRIKDLLVKHYPELVTQKKTHEEF